MSAASSGFELPYVVIAPFPSDLTGIKIGSQLIQRSRIINSPHDSYSKWFIKKISGNNITVSPIRGLWFKDDLILTEDLLKEKFRIQRSI